MRKLSMLLVGVFALALMVPAALPAAGFPDRDITLVVPWAAGGGTDTLGRTLVKNAKKYFGVNMNVVNRVGGTASIGMNSVATAKPDGYTVLLATFNLSTYRLIGLNNLTYRDFDLIALLNRSVAGLSVKADSKMQTLKDFVEYAKANPGVLTVSNPGPGSPWHLTAVAFAHEHNLKMNMISFDGSAPSRTALVGGHVSAASTGLDEVLQFYQTKQIRILAATSQERNSFFPDVPTVGEAGYPVKNLIFDWRGLVTAKGTPPEVLKILRDGFRKAAQDPEYITLMDKMALPRTYMEYDKFEDFLVGSEKSLEPVLGLVGLLKK
jgi:tripartite-type tricarboxylate transporter receptor subunit TctC